MNSAELRHELVFRHQLPPTEIFIRQLAVKQITDFLLGWVMGETDLTKEEVLQVLKRLWPENIFK